MGTSKSNKFSMILLSHIFLFSISWWSSVFGQENFLQCLSLRSDQPPIPVYTPNTSSYSSILQSSIQNLRFISSDTPKPQVIITPSHESHVQAAVICCRKHGLQIRVRSGGHDYEGLSYTSDVPFVVVDLANFESIVVDVEDRSAWVQAGATIGQVYYRIAEKTSAYGFPAGGCPTVGVGGHFSAGGYGGLFRKYGLAADNIIDARIVTVDGKISDKESMGEDLFWAIRGGGGGSFGVILSWKIRLVPVPPVMTLSTVSRRLEQGATELVYKWQNIAHQLPKDLVFAVFIRRVNGSEETNEKIQAIFISVFQGRTKQLLQIMEQKFPELGLKSEDCIEMSWIQSALYLAEFPFDGPRDVLLNRNQRRRFFKAKSDYVKETIPEIGLKGIWTFFNEVDIPEMILSPYGGRMSEISESALPFSHRKGNLFKIQYIAWWEKAGAEESKKNINWIRRLYKYMTPYVSKSPRSAYLNYRDLDLGHSENGTASYDQARVWGIKYFGNNFDRLVHVKSKVDPENFFRNEQSIPSVPEMIMNTES